MTECPRCGAPLVSVGNPDEGVARVGWWCEPCSALYRDGDYVKMRMDEIEA